MDSHEISSADEKIYNIFPANRQEKFYGKSEIFRTSGGTAAKHKNCVGDLCVKTKTKHLKTGNLSLNDDSALLDGISLSLNDISL